ncbi:MAG: hypothetical protein ACJAUP_001833 [Cellvibrionaceae bacterium]|jgi:hypothetical protein
MGEASHIVEAHFILESRHPVQTHFILEEAWSGKFNTNKIWLNLLANHIVKVGA